MQEYDENKAIELMATAAGLNASDDTVVNSVSEVLDTIYDYFETNGELNLSDLDDDTDEDVAAAVQYIQKQFRKYPTEIEFTEEQLTAMVEAELDYEDSII